MTVTTSDFLGLWQIERTIEDGHSASRAVFTGEASISHDVTHCIYAEVGTLAMAGVKPMTAERRYLWRPDANGFDISFTDERFFHRLSLSGPTQAAHWCDPDQYDVIYDFTDFPSWKSTWHVVGPRKNYVMHSAFRRG
jgi:hypothetical protein